MKKHYFRVVRINDMNELIPEEHPVFEHLVAELVEFMQTEGNTLVEAFVIYGSALPGNIHEISLHFNYGPEKG